MNLFEFNLALPITDPTWVFFLVLIIILFAPMILGCLYIPYIIDMILVGVLIGEHGFHVLGRDSSFKLFSKVELYYIMFLAGLEVDMRDFKKSRMKNVVFGLLTFLIPMALGIWSSMSMLGYDFLTAVLLASMYASHALIAYSIISRYGLSRLCSVNITIGGMAITITLALIILAVIGGMSKGTIDGLFWVLLVMKVAFLGLLTIFFFLRIGRWLFRKYDDNVMQFVFVLAMVFLGGGLTEFVGMEGILGALLAGLVLNCLIPHVSLLMSRLESVGNALLIPYFLIGVDMIIDIRSPFTGGEASKAAVVMIVVIAFSKQLAAWITQKIYRMQLNERSMIFGFDNAQAAVTLAAVLIGYEVIMENGEHLLNDDVLNGTVVMIPFTCVINSLVTERLARRFALSENAQPEDKGAKKAMEQILTPVANPETVENLVNLALVIKDAKQKSGMTVLNVINGNNSSENKELQGKQNLEKAAMIVATADVPATMVSRYDLNIASGIMHMIKEYEATDVAIGLHRKVNIVDFFFGNLAESLSKGTHHEVITAKFLMPANTLCRIITAVPPRAEFETGFSKWAEHSCRMGSIFGCRVHSSVNRRILTRLQQLVEKKFSGTPTEFPLLEEWGDFLLLTGQVNYDHLFAVISAHRSSISYDPSFEHLPAQLSKYFFNNSLITLYLDQFGDPQETVSSFDPRGYNESQHYEKVGKWSYKWSKKS